MEHRRDTGALTSFDGHLADITTLSSTNQNGRVPWTSAGGVGKLYFMDHGLEDAGSLDVPGLVFQSCLPQGEDMVCLVKWRGQPSALPGCSFWTPLRPSTYDAALISLARDGSRCRFLHEFRTTPGSRSAVVLLSPLLETGGRWLIPVLLGDATSIATGTPPPPLKNQGVLVRHARGVSDETDLTPGLIPQDAVERSSGGVALTIRNGTSSSLSFLGVQIAPEREALLLLRDDLSLERAFSFMTATKRNFLARSSAVNGRLAFVVAGRDLAINGEPMTRNGDEYLHVFVIEDR
jgi:hypothetical protein